jgi:Polysaccharide biosynthesis/export protein
MRPLGSNERNLQGDLGTRKRKGERGDHFALLFSLPSHLSFRAPLRSLFGENRKAAYRSLDSGPALALLCLFACRRLLASGPAKSSSASAQHADTQPYRIRVQDVLEITVWKERELSGCVIVPPDGAITLPLMDDVRVVGPDSSRGRGVNYREAEALPKRAQGDRYRTGNRSEATTAATTGSGLIWPYWHSLHHRELGRLRVRQAGRRMESHD